MGTGIIRAGSGLSSFACSQILASIPVHTERKEDSIRDYIKAAKNCFSKAKPSGFFEFYWVFLVNPVFAKKNFKISMGFQLVDSYEFLFGQHSITYTNTCEFKSLIVT